MLDLRGDAYLWRRHLILASLYRQRKALFCHWRRYGVESVLPLVLLSVLDSLSISLSLLLRSKPAQIHRFPSFSPTEKDSQAAKELGFWKSAGDQLQNPKAAYQTPRVDLVRESVIL